MSGSCHLDRALNVEIGVECQILLLLPFLTETEFYNLRKKKTNISSPKLENTTSVYR